MVVVGVVVGVVVSIGRLVGVQADGMLEVVAGVVVEDAGCDTVDFASVSFFKHIAQAASVGVRRERAFAAA